MREALLAYCSVRILGEDLAAAGYPTLRFDYSAAGNSLDADLNQGGAHWTVWQKSIETAIDWLKGVSGAERVVLCGVRTGGTLATLVAERRGDVAGLLLFEPVIIGRSYVRQLILEADLQRGHPMPREQGLEIREMNFTAATVAQMAEFDLRKAALPVGLPVAVFARPEFKPMDECVQAWAGREVKATKHGFDGLLQVVRHDTLEENQLADFTRPLTWLKATLPPIPSYPVATGSISPGVAALQPPGCFDTPLKFGPDSRLFGILCRPERGSTEDMVLIPNGGRDPSFGAARQHVVLARRLAQAGIASFRFDFAGLGDSIGPPGKERVFTHAFTDRTADTRAAVDAMAELGFSRFSMHGLCVGAYHALYGALAEPRLSALMLINLPLFTVPVANALGQLEQRGQSARFYLAKMLRPSAWGHLLGGKSDLPMLKRAALFHLRRHTIERLQNLARRLGLAASQSFAHRAMADLSRRGVRTLYLFSDGKQDIEAFAAEFGADGAGLKAYRGAEMRIVPSMDHSLTITAGRVPAETMMVEFVAAGRPSEAATKVSGNSLPA
jgi:pimeloyl-ACP methyl ester carboxylesterase